MKILCSSAGNNVDLTASRTTKLWAVAAALNLELVNGIDVGIHQQRKVRAVVEIVCAVDGPVILGIAGAIHRETDDVDAAGGVGGSHIKLISCIAAYARLQCNQLFIIVVVERQ